MPIFGRHSEEDKLRNRVLSRKELPNAILVFQCRSIVGELRNEDSANLASWFLLWEK